MFKPLQNKHNSNQISLLRKSHFVDKDFQLKYTLIVVGAAAVGLSAAAIPLYYFINQNYDIFSRLAYQTAPQLLEHLEREKVFMSLLLLFSSLTTLCFTALFAFKFTARIVAPLNVLKNHLKFLSRGNWSQHPLKVRDNDEFLDLIEAYNYFYKSFQRCAAIDLEKLKQLHINKDNRNAELLWIEMIEDKERQLNISSDAISNVLKSEKYPDQLHVS